MCAAGCPSCKSCPRGPFIREAPGLRNPPGTWCAGAVQGYMAPAAVEPVALGRRKLAGKPKEAGDWHSRTSWSVSLAALA